MKKVKHGKKKKNKSALRHSLWGSLLWDLSHEKESTYKGLGGKIFQTGWRAISGTLIYEWGWQIHGLENSLG